MIRIRATRLFCLLLLLPAAAHAQQEPSRFPARVLITNDNGIDDPKIIALARALAPLAETWVVAPAADRSGSGSFLSVTGTGRLTAEARDLGPGIRAFAVHGYPADCVVLALLALMDAPPDLVISGINGGPNLGADWFGSGTIGAARTAAIAGIRAIAVSGLDDDIPGAMHAAVNFVVRFAMSDAARRIDPPEYLTIGLPRVAPDSIRGIRVADRAPLTLVPRLERVDSMTWRVTGMTRLPTYVAPDSDSSLWEEDYIVITPMHADEVDLRRLARWRRGAVRFPEWSARPN